MQDTYNEIDIKQTHYDFFIQQMYSIKKLLYFHYENM